MNELQIFNNPEFGEIRLVDVDGKPYAVARDVALALGYAKPENAVSQHCKGTLKRGIPTAGGEQLMNIIPEGDVYRLIVNSQLPAAEQFERWVFDEILPTIHKHGVYMTTEAIEHTLSNPEFIISLAEKWKLERDARIEAESQITVLAPKAEFYDTVTGSRTAIPFDKAAKVLGYKGIGRNNLFEFLRNASVLMPDNQPYQAYIDRGYFRVVESTFTKPNGDVQVTTKTLVYQRGLDYVRRLLDKAGYQQNGASVVTPRY